MALQFLPSQNLFLSHYFIYTPEEMEHIDRLQKEYHASNEELSFAELVETFHDNKEEIKVLLKEQIEDLKTQRAGLLETLERCNIAISKIYSQRWFSEMIADLWIKQEIIVIDKDIKKLVFQISSFSSTKDVANGQLTDQQIAQAKAVPLTNFLKINRAGFSVCPLHKDTHPSLKVYAKQNRWYCFSCNQGGDNIYLIQKIYQYNFRETVFFLIK